MGDKMGVAERYQNRLAEQNNKGVRYRYELNQFQNNQDDLNKKISAWESSKNDYLNSYNSLLKQYKNQQGNVNYSDASNFIKEVRLNSNVLMKNAAVLKSDLEKYSKFLGSEETAKLIQAIDDTEGWKSQTDAQLKNISDYYSQWDSEEAYNAAMKQQEERQKEYQRLMALDVEATKQQYQQAQSSLDQVSKELSSILPDGSTRYDSVPVGLADKIKTLKAQKDELQNQVNTYYKDYNDASQLQKSEKYNNLTKSQDFEKLAKQGLAIKSPQYKDIQGKSFVDELFADYDSVSDIADNSAMLTDEEKNIYGYLVATQGENAANEYLTSLLETINYRRGARQADNVQNSKLWRLAYAVPAGVDQFAGGIAQNFQEDRLPTSATQFASGDIREDLNGTGWQVGYDLINTTANMAPSILLSSLITAATGGAGAPVVGAIGAAVTGTSARGNAINEALAEGYTPDQASAYGTLVGASEGALQYLLGGISKLGGKLTGNVAQKAIGKIDNVLLRVAADTGIHMTGEGAEEYLQEILTPVFRNIAFDENNEFKLFTEEALYSGILGALSAGLMEGPSSISNAIINRQVTDANQRGELAGDIAQLTAQNLPQSQVSENYAAPQAEAAAGFVQSNTASQPKYSIRTDASGNKYVNVDTDQNIFEGVDPRQYSKIANQYILEHFRGKVIGDSDRAYVNKRTAEEFTHPANRRLDQGIRDSKMKSATELDNLMSASRFIEHIDDDGRHPDATGGWDTYSVDFVVDGQPFNGVISVMNTDHGRVFYDMTKIRSLTDRKGDLSGQALHVASVDKTSLTPTIPQDTAGVNINISENGGNDTGRPIRIAQSELDQMKTVSEKLGVKLRIADPGEQYDGSYQDGVITISPRTSQPALVVYKHELTHYIAENTSYYGKLRDLVKEYYQQENANYPQLVQYRQDAHQLAGEKIDYSGAEQEIVADFVGEHLFTDERAIQRLVEQEPNLGMRIKNWIRGVLAYFKKDQQPALLLKAERLYQKAIDQVQKQRQKGARAKPGEVKHSIRYTKDNKPVVVVEENILEGVPRSEWVKTVKQTISEKFSGGIPVSGRLVKVNRISKNEYINSKYSQGIKSNNNAVYRDKFKSANNLDEIVLASTNYINEDLKHERKDNFKEFARGDVLIRVGENNYSAKVIVGFTAGNQMVLYDVIDFKPTSLDIKERTHNTAMQNAGSDRKRAFSSDTTVPQKEQSVNTYSMQNGEKHSLNKRYTEMVEQYGKMKPGEHPAREVDVPKQTAEGNRVRQTVRTAMEAKGTPQEMVDRLKAEIINDAYSYKPISDQSSQNYAKNMLKDRGFVQCYRRWRDTVVNEKAIGKKDMALAEQMYIESLENGDFNTAQEIMVDLAAEATRSGQNVQAIRLLKNLTPEGRIYKIDSLVNKLQKMLDDKLKDKAPVIKVSEELKQQMLRAKSIAEMEDVEDAAVRYIAEQMPKADKIRKWNEWRYLAMLGNFRTHIRNIVGNAVFTPAIMTKNALGVALEQKIPKEQRTKAFLSPKDTALWNFAKQDFEEQADFVAGERKDSHGIQAVEKYRRVFGPEILEKLRKLNSNLLEREDRIFLRLHYQNSMAQLIKARGWDINNLTKQQLNDARNYATQEARKATYRDESKVASALNRISRSSRLAEILIEGAVPFKKTPINILKRGIEYSPAGLTKGLIDLGIALKQGESVASAIDNICSGLTGTGILILGAFLSRMGVLKSTSDDDKEGELDDLSGGQEYAIEIGGVSYTIDWAAPLTMPLFVGAEIEKALSSEETDAEESFGRLIDAMGNISDPMFSLSMLQGINNTLKAVRYGENPAMDIVSNVAAGYVGQAIPTLSGQLTRTVDGTRRETYYSSQESKALQSLEKAIRKNAAKVPILSAFLEPYVDKWGNEQNEGNIFTRALENFFSPGYASSRTNDKVTDEVSRIYAETENTSVVPRYAPSTLKQKDENYRLSSKEHTRYQKTLGQTSHQKLEELIGSPWYQKLNDEERAEVIAKLYTYANETAKKEFYDGRGISYSDMPTIKKFNNVEQAGINLYEYLAVWIKTKDIEGRKNAKGDTISGSVKQNKINYMVNELGISRVMANKLYEFL